MLKNIFATEDFPPNDDLSSILQNCVSGEINEEELDCVVAARKNEYETFIERVQRKTVE